MDFSPFWPVICRGKNSPFCYIFIFFADVIVRKLSSQAMEVSQAATWRLGALGCCGVRGGPVQRGFEVTGDGQPGVMTVTGLSGSLVFGCLLISDFWVMAR